MSSDEKPPRRRRRRSKQSGKRPRDGSGERGGRGGPRDTAGGPGGTEGATRSEKSGKGRGDRRRRRGRSPGRPSSDQPRKRKSKRPPKSDDGPPRESLWRDFHTDSRAESEGDDEQEVRAEVAVEDGPAPTELAADLPDESDDPDPSTASAASDFSTSPLHDVVGVKFHAAGKVYTFDSAGSRYAEGEEVMVESDSGPRWGRVAWSTRRRTENRKQLRRVLRHPNDEDRARLEREDAENDRVLGLAKSIARRHELPIKVFRCESGSSGRVVVYFSSESKVDARPLVRDLSGELGGRVDTRQTGVRDEAKMVGGIGSCGQELCCTTWLPAFVPVSIKNAKDQGLVLNPTKVSGQCGRLKCCLVYEHATYAELRKGLPKMGKRVVTEDGEGRVVEVDVLRQRIRVSLVEGAVKVYGKDEVEPMFPSQPSRDSSGPPHKRKKRRGKGGKAPNQGEPS